MSRIPELLKKGDLIYITSPAKAADEESVFFSKAYLESLGFKVMLSKNCLGHFHYFSGTDEERTQDFQEGIDHPEVKAILCARGGYGSIRIVDRILWASQIRQPKWIIGYSDITVFHQRMQRFDITSLHSTMPLNFPKNSPDSLSTLITALTQEHYEIKHEGNPSNKEGETEGILVGGNLSILYALLGTDDQINYKDKILFIEDIGEHYYQLDRMFYALSKSGIFDQIAGLIVGGMTELEDTVVPFGQNIEEIILSHMKYRNIPVAFDFPSGHHDHNLAIRLGAKVSLKVSETEVVLEF